MKKEAGKNLGHCCVNMNVNYGWQLTEAIGGDEGKEWAG